MGEYCFCPGVSGQPEQLLKVEVTTLFYFLYFIFFIFFQERVVYYILFLYCVVVKKLTGSLC